MNGQTNRHNKKKRTYPAWAPRFWHGMLFTDWLKLVWKNRCRIHPLRLGLASTVSALTAFNSTMRLLDNAIYRKRVQGAPLVDDPIFILGHWRSGTTYLHELMSCDERFATPTTFQCFAANHFLVTESWMPKLIWFLMPEKRPMDNVRMGWQEPQEDEFALCSMGVPSPYLRIAFPKDGDEYIDYLDLVRITEDELQQWKETFQTFLQRLTLKTGKRIILKSPTHTGRLAVLNQLFPNARFLHIVRDPMSIFPSTVNLWDSLDEAQGLQFRKHTPNDLICRTFARMYSAFESTRSTIPQHRIIDIRYEDLVREPKQKLKEVYKQLELGDFDQVASKLESKLRAGKDYQTNRYQLSQATIELIREHFADYSQRYGYEP